MLGIEGHTYLVRVRLIRNLAQRLHPPHPVEGDSR